MKYIKQYEKLEILGILTIQLKKFLSELFPIELSIMKDDRSSMFRCETKSFGVTDVYNIIDITYENYVSVWLYENSNDDRLKEISKFLIDILDKHITLEINRTLNFSFYTYEIRTEETLNNIIEELTIENFELLKNINNFNI